MTAALATKTEATAVPRPAPAPLLQRKCAKCEAHESDDDRPLLQRRGRGAAGGVPASVDAALASPGRALPSAARDTLEPSLGTDLGHVRVHDGPTAHRAAAEVSADAFTVGPDIAFAAGRYDPGSEAGLALLGHEVAHTIQQGGLMRSAADGGLARGESAALEAEADAAGLAAAAGRPAPPLTRLGLPALALKPSGRAFRQPGGADRLPAFVKGVEDKPKEVSTAVAALDLGTLELPAKKGDVLTAWKAEADAGSLESVMGLVGNIRPELKQARPDTITLRDIWRTKHGWSGTADELWAAAGGAPGFKAKKNGKTCHVDHIVELQFTGNNTRENLQILDADPNMESGRWLNKTLTDAARDVREARPDLREVVLHYGTVVPSGAAECGPCCELDRKAATAAAAKAEKGAAAEKEATEPYTIRVANPTTLKVPPIVGKKPEPVRLADSTIPENRSASTIVAGLRLDELNRAPAGAKGKRAIDSIDATFDREKARLPLTLAKSTGAVVLSVAGDDGRLAIRDPSKAVRFVYPYLSEGAFTRLDVSGEEVSGAGYIDVKRIPFLGRIDIALEHGELTVTKGLDKKALKPPIPGFHVTDASLGLKLAPEFKPFGELAFALGSESKPLMTGKVSATAEGSVFVARGTLDARIPGLDEASGIVTYRSDTGWNAVIDLATAKLPRAKKAAVRVTVADSGNGSRVDASGTLVIEPFDGQEVTLKIDYRGGRFVYGGSALLKPPVKGVDPVRLTFVYAGNRLEAEGKTGFHFRGLTGEIAVHYVDGDIEGAGWVEFKKAKASGRIDGKLSKHGRFSGKGGIRYRLTDKLELEGGIEIDEQQKVRLSGALIYNKPIQIFPKLPRDGGRKDLLNFKKLIPVPGVSIPGVGGIVVDLSAGIYVAYSVGPGQLLETRIDAALDPLEDDPDPMIAFKTRLDVRAHAGVGGFIRGGIGIGVSLGPCEGALTGGLRLDASGDLYGGLNAPFEATYQGGRFTIEARPSIEAGFVVGLDLSADINARAGCFGFGVDETWTWKLASKQIDTGLKFVMTAPIKYASDTGFTLPTIDQIDWTLPSLDPADLAGRIVKSSSPKES